MNVYEAIAASPIGVARHDKGRVLTESDPSIIWCARNMRSGWQPLYVSPWEYTLGEPLTELIPEQPYIAIRKSDGRMEQGTWKKHQYNVSGCMWTYYADPRPLPVPPEPKEEPKLVHQFYEGQYCLTDKGAALLERLLNESEAKDEIHHSAVRNAARAL